MLRYIIFCDRDYTFSSQSNEIYLVRYSANQSQEHSIVSLL